MNKNEEGKHFSSLNISTAIYINDMVSVLVISFYHFFSYICLINSLLSF